MSEMIERVAKAMEKFASQPLYNLPSLEPVLVGSLGDVWEYLARAAVEAMREPTEEMIHAGVWGSALRTMGKSYTAMIDAALIDSRQPETKETP